MVTFGVILAGIIAFMRLPQELFPPISFPQVTIVANYANAAPEEIETLITKPLEEAVGSVAGLKRIESVSREGRATILVSFNWGQDIDFAALAVREKIDLVKERLPKEAEDPVVLKFDPLSRPIMMLSVTGKDIEPVHLKYLTEKMIKDNLEKVEGVASAVISGGLNREIQIDVDLGRLEANHLSLGQIVEAVEQANISYPAGSIKKGLYEYMIRTVGDFQSVKEIEYAVAGTDIVQKVRREDTSFVEKGDDEGPRQTLDTLRSEVKRQLLEKRLVLVRDVAEVIDGTAQKTSVSRHNGKENITVSIQKQASANTIEVVNRLKESLAVLAPDLSSRGVHAEIVYDHSIFIRKSLENLAEEAKQGGLLALVCLWFFLRALGPSFLVMLSVPLSVLCTFLLMSLGGITLNTMSIGGLVLAIGMITDTSIVVLENIFRKRQQGENAETAAISGTEEVVWPVVSSNLTTIAVFFPLIVFVPGIAGQIFKDLSWTIIFSQIASTIMPITLLTLLSTYLKVKVQDYKPLAWTAFFERKLVGNDKPLIPKLAFLGLLLGVVFCICGFFAMTIFPSLEREVLPKVDQGQFLVKIDMPLGTRLEVTDRVSQKIEEALKSIEAVKDVTVTIGSERSERGQVKVEALRQSQGLIMVALQKKRKMSSADVIHVLRDKVDAIDTEKGRIDFVLQESEFAFAEGGVKPILIEVKGYSFDEMSKMTELIKKKIGEIPGVFNVQDDMGEPVPERKMEIDKKRAALYGISALDISLTAKTAIEGIIATEYREQGKEFEVRIRLSEKDRNNLDNINNLLLYSRVLDELVPLKEVATVKSGLGPSEIKRANQERTITISADIDKKAKSTEVLTGVQTALKNIPFDPAANLSVSLSGKAREVSENFSLVMFAFILAIVLNYMIMASQFESFLQPLIIMVTVPLALFGVSLALWISGHSLSVISLLGCILLAGTAVNNGIVLIEYINQAREEGMEIEEAAWMAAKIRTRPILMSAFTSVVGLIPLALGLGEGAELRSPMAVAMIGGTISSTFLTLIVIPSLYIFITRVSELVFGVPEDESV